MPELIQVPTDGVVSGYVGAVVPFVAKVRFFTTHKSTITLHSLIKPTDSSLKGVTAEAGAIEDTKPCPKDKACYTLTRKYIFLFSTSGKPTKINIMSPSCSGEYGYF